MAVYGVVADIHGNREALLAALGELDLRGCAGLLCLGDIVGYNADPDECVAIIRDRGGISIAGNHDLIGLGRLGFARCSNKARYSLKRTRHSLSPWAAVYLRSMPPTRALEAGVVLIHGGVRDVEQYMAAPSIVARNAAYASVDFPLGRIFLFGHTHEQKVYEVDGVDGADRGEVRELPARGRVQLRPDRRYFINPGSVDASRKREHKLAECAILDTGTRSVEFVRVPYDEGATERKAASAGYRIGPWTDRLYSLGKRLSFRRA
jgi:predicted phosphodiesterase